MQDSLLGVVIYWGVDMLGVWPSVGLADLFGVGLLLGVWLTCWGVANLLGNHGAAVWLVWEVDTSCV